MKIFLKIGGMSCTSCSAKIENKITKINGVKKAQINFSNGVLLLDFEESIVSYDYIVSQIELLGYSAKKVSNSFYEIQDEKANELKKLKSNFWFSLILGSPVIIYSVARLFSLPMVSIPIQLVAFIQLVLATIVILINSNIYISGFKKILNRDPNMDSLIEIGTFAAYFYSLAVSFLIWFYPTIHTGSLYFESAIMILIFISLGKYLEFSAKEKTNNAIKDIIEMQPQEANLVAPEGKKVVAITSIKKNDIVFISPGERIPVDGIVVDGISAVDEKVITGESIPLDKIVGSRVIGGTINLTGSLTIKTTNAGEDSILAKIIKVMEEASSSKAPIQLLADRAAYYFVPAVVSIALIASLFWFFVGMDIFFILTIFVSVLIVACPCTLGLATPTAVIMGIGLGVKSGILIKSGKALEAAAKINFVVFDKTGTLTKGEPEIIDYSISGISENDFIQIIGSLEDMSEHSLAAPIVKKMNDLKIKSIYVDDFKALVGKGIGGIIKGKKYLFGSYSLMKENHFDMGEFLQQMESLGNRGATVMFLSSDEKVLGCVGIKDVIRSEAKEVVYFLKSKKIKIGMITGDNKLAAMAIGKDVGIDFIYSQVLPHEKAEIIKQIQKDGYNVAMIGDGINDAPALIQSNLGIVMASGSDISIEAGEAVLMNNDLKKMLALFDLGKYSVFKIKQNLFWAFFYNILGILVAGGIFYYTIGWLLSPALAAAAMALSSFSVVCNSLSMKYYKEASLQN